jgi:hypothetical protein
VTTCAPSATPAKSDHDWPAAVRPCSTIAASRRLVGDGELAAELLDLRGARLAGRERDDGELVTRLDALDVALGVQVVLRRLLVHDGTEHGPGRREDQVDVERLKGQTRDRSRHTTRVGDQVVEVRDPSGEVVRVLDLICGHLDLLSSSGRASPR